MTDTLLYWKAPDGTRTRDLLITNQSLYQLSHGSALNRTILWYQRQRVLSREKWKFTRYVTKALRCNDFVAGPVSLQLTGHPFAKPHVPCVVALQLCFAHERASTSSCWSVKSSCKHEIYPNSTWRLNCWTKKGWQSLRNSQKSSALTSGLWYKECINGRTSFPKHIYYTVLPSVCQRDFCFVRRTTVHRTCELL